MKNLVGCLLVIFGSFSAMAEEHIIHSQHMVGNDSDSRQLVSYPPELRAHVLANMRGHLQALAEIMEALASNQYKEAADIAQMQLGMNSPAATGCRMDGTGKAMMPMSESTHLDQIMSHLMPERMKELGQNMHRSADEFAMLAREAGEHGNDGVAITASLAKVTQHCVTCHASYRLQ